MGSLGSADIGKGVIQVDGQQNTPAAKPGGKKRKAPTGNAYQTEHDVLFDAIRNNKPHYEVDLGVSATMTAILGRMATYSGKLVTWEQAFNSKLSLLPERIDWNAPPRDLPDSDGNYSAAIPGLTKAF
jgi:hypothetical protein